MRFYVAALPHTEPTDEYSWCAYTQKTRRFVAMMKSLGHSVKVAWGEGLHGHIPDFDPMSPLFTAYAKRAIAAFEDTDAGGFLAITAGAAQRPIADALPHLIPVEVGVGYGGVFADFCVFESYAWMHSVYGSLAILGGGSAHSADGRFYDAVIPNAYDSDEFEIGDGSGGYLLYIGRGIARKGIEIARLTAERAKLPLIEVGADTRGGIVGPAERQTLMSGAVATLVPTTYVEPFGGVAVESMMCGTPAITTDWGAFTETVEPGVTGYRCRDLGEFAWAAKNAGHLNRERIAARARERFSTEVVRHEYERYFERLATPAEMRWHVAPERPPALS